MEKRVLLVGLEYNGPKYDDIIVETRGLCCPENGQLYAAAPLYDYDVIIIYPESYSHFIFGKETKHSSSLNELWDLKRENNTYDLDSIFYRYDREQELEAAIRQGTRVIWLMTPDKRTQFFGYRSVYHGYLSPNAEKYIRESGLHIKNSKKINIENTKRNYFQDYFEQLMVSGWRLCWVTNSNREEHEVLAKTPENYCLGASISRDGHKYWILTPPTSEEALGALIRSTCAIPSDEVPINKYHGIFLSHNSEDKPFVRKLRNSLLEKGINDVWLDEAEIMIGDSLIQKIHEGLKKSEYFGIVLSENSIKSTWVQKELEQAMMMEISSKNVKVLPLLLEKCELPPFLQGKLYADFTSPTLFNESLEKLVRRLEIRH